ncbi:MAG: GIY-YIG nuclease family protein [Candidatus Magasanikbacteria bacterium]|jgi:excinuclease ABC subunit C|nr:GIY-YIG nuclease family protein [Candidatus Magasanikbacteria bacterium]MBT4221078.1 GIY-YIG nuclease family protein [Candidatus Magasanikbacteria bacterium]MBT4350578.1 GIY-YIG nuclease family protein [Candidatus Magasanikbacteria bacterium]MBT4542123.1 GIY-YIG nuclease family protein [Candidatus Magasanikbacteria bacterium]MBT6253245.1 GIY-YIG nuclease family protein [Candidatus Magasanikbacteria bacterium]
MDNDKGKKKAKRLPDSPGIYLFFNQEKDIIYVGKATSLKSRVTSYFVGKRTSRPIERMIHEVQSIKTQSTESVLEAIVLEANAIKKYQPKYNVIGKDNKSWNYITISRSGYPILETAREHDLMQIETDEMKKQYRYIFGPYPGLNTKAAIKILTRLFHLSTCQKKRRKKDGDKPCLYYQMGQCLGVCTKEITKEDYKKKVIAPLVTFLKGGKKRLIKTFEKDMKKAAKAYAFEEAARLRDQVQNLTKIQDITLINKSFVEDSLYVEGQIQKVEGYDISNLGSSNKVGSMVVFTHGGPDKRQYRKFKIKTVEGQSDVACLKEVLERRLKHKEWPLPDLFLIDGGKPQVNTAKKVLALAGVDRPIVGIAKGAARKKNEFIIPDANRVLIKWVKMNQDMLVNVRDEAHRFAIAFQRKRRKIKK